MTFPFPIFSPDLVVSDPYFSSVVLLVTFTGSNGSTTFTDQSSAARALTANGNAQIQSNYLELDGTTDFVSALDSTDFEFSGDFTVEIFGLQTDNAGIYQTIISKWDAFSPHANKRGWTWAYRGADATPNFTIAFSSAGTSGSVTSVAANYTLSTATDYNICLERSGSTVRTYVDGTMIGSGTNSSTVSNQDTPLAIGTDNPRASTTTNLNELDGRMKAVRITTGVARYATDTSYTVPSLPLPTS